VTTTVVVTASTVPTTIAAVVVTAATVAAAAALAVATAAALTVATLTAPAVVIALIVGRRVAASVPALLLGRVVLAVAVAVVAVVVTLVVDRRGGRLEGTLHGRRGRRCRPLEGAEGAGADELQQAPRGEADPHADLVPVNALPSLPWCPESSVVLVVAASVAVTERKRTSTTRFP
jgi:hypothetical protein